MKHGERVRARNWRSFLKGDRKRSLIIDLGNIPELETIKNNERLGKERKWGSLALGEKNLKWKLHLHPTDVNMSTQRGCR